MKIALIAHDKKKDEMVAFAKQHKERLLPHDLYATGTTGKRLIDEVGLDVHRFKSGPLGGDQQIGAMVSENDLDLIIFLRDVLTAQAHEPDITALLRLCDVYDIPLATNVGSAHVMILGLEAGFLKFREKEHGKEWTDLTEVKEHSGDIDLKTE